MVASENDGRACDEKSVLCDAIAGVCSIVDHDVHLSFGMDVPPDPDRPQRVFEKPPIVTWVDRNILYLMPIEIGLVILLAVLTIMLDSWFDPQPSDRSTSSKKTRLHKRNPDPRLVVPRNVLLRTHPRLTGNAAVDRI